MMKTNGENMGRIVQRAVESEFQEKGYSGTKMLAIVRQAGVACLMLHYYYKRWKTVSSGHAAENAWDSPFCRECCCNLETLETICDGEGSGVSDGEWKQE